MKKNILRFAIAPIFLITVISFCLLALNNAQNNLTPKKKAELKAMVCKSGCATSCSTILTDCYGGPGCTTPFCTSVYKVANFGATYNVNQVTISSMNVCYVPSGTPTWSSFTQVGKIMNASYLPPATRVFNASTSGGTVFKCTVYTNGDFYMQYFSGTYPSGSTVTLSGYYGLKCSTCNS